MEGHAATERTRRLLFADDNEAWRELFCMQFNKVAPDWKIVPVCEGKEAMCRLRDMDALDALVTDIQMPEMGGLELIEWLRAQPQYRTLPVFVVSGSEESDHHGRCTALGVEKFINKSGSMDILRNNIREIVRLSEECHVRFRSASRDSFALNSRLPLDRIGRPINSLSRKSRSPDKSRPNLANPLSLWPFAAIGKESWRTSGVLELVRARVAQIHQCPESLACHMAILEERGEGARLDELETWQTSTLFTNAERAALALCDCITLEPTEPLLESLLREMHCYFTNDGIIGVTMAIVAAADWSSPHASYPAINLPGS